MRGYNFTNIGLKIYKMTHNPPPPLIPNPSPPLPLLDQPPATVRSPSLPAGIFTQSTMAHAKIVAALARDGYKVFEFTGATAVKKVG